MRVQLVIIMRKSLIRLHWSWSPNPHCCPLILEGPIATNSHLHPSFNKICHKGILINPGNYFSTTTTPGNNSESNNGTSGSSEAIARIESSSSSSGEMPKLPLTPQELSELETLYLTPPTTCCRSGCPECVWIEYVEKLSEFYSDPSLGKEKIHQDIESIEDPSIKAWIIMELKGKGLW